MLAPDAVGSSVVGDVLADQENLRRNRIPADDPLASENEGSTIKSILAVPLVDEEAPIGALVLVNKRGRHPEFSAEDEELLTDLARQAVRALRIARQHEAEKKVEELDALLAVSREITATLDLDKVMGTIVNATSTLIPYERCAIGIFEKGRLRLGAVSGAQEIDRKDPNVRRLEELLKWVFLSGTDVAVTQTEDGEITAERPETVEKFRAIFAGDGAALLLRRPPQGRGGQARSARIREHGAPRLRRRDARPARDPRQPGDRRGAQRPALPAGPARRIPAAPARETAAAARHPRSPAAGVAHRRGGRGAGADRRSLARPRRRTRPRASGATGGR